jgi:hypothetical protein
MTVKHSQMGGRRMNDILKCGWFLQAFKHPHSEESGQFTNISEVEYYDEESNKWLAI